MGGRPERCRRHPNHKESKGVCPFCLRERLSYLPASSSSSSTARGGSSTSISTSPDSSDSDRPDGQSDVVGSRPQPLHKSRSLAAMIGRELDEEGKEDKGRREKKNNNIKKVRFWSKLMRKKKEDGGLLLHSKTVKDKSSTKWVLF